MALELNFTKEVLESIIEILGQKDGILFRRLANVEVKAERHEPRVIVLTGYKIFVFLNRAPSKIEQCIHYLELETVISKGQNKCVLGAENKKLSINFSATETDTFIVNIGEALAAIFPKTSFQRLIPNFEINPPDRMMSLSDKLQDAQHKSDPSPCGGFSTAYRAYCDYHNLPYQEDVAWDVDTIYLSHDCREMNLGDFDHLSPRHLIPIIAALEHNVWFTKLNTSGNKLTLDSGNAILKVLKTNSTLEELWMANSGIKADFTQRLAATLLSNPKTGIHLIDLSNNMIEDKGITHIFGPLTKLSRGLTHLNLSRTNLTAKGLNKLAEALCGNNIIPNTLKYLNLSGNSLKGDDNMAIHKFLGELTALTYLDLSQTECALENLFGALCRGCTQNLAHLDLSGNVYSNKKSKDYIKQPSWKNFFASCLALRKLNLADCKPLPADIIKDVLTGLGGNPNIDDVEVNLASNNLSQTGLHVLVDCMSSISNIGLLNISDNGFDTEMYKITSSINQNKCVKKLYLGRNFNNTKPKQLPQQVESILQLFEAEDSVLEALSLADSKLRMETAIIINALGANSTLCELDISGNQMGDFGARMLAKALQINTKLHTIYWDNNQTTPLGFQAIAAALEKNFTMKKMPIPLNDAMSALKVNYEKTEAALEQIELLLQRNHSPRKFASEQKYRLQQGLLISSTQQMVDRLVVKISDTMSRLDDKDIPQEDLDQAKAVVKDADASRRLMDVFQKMTVTNEDESTGVKKKLQSISRDLHFVMETQIKRSVSEMMSTAKDQCPAIMADKKFYNDVEDRCKEKSALTPNFAEDLLVEQVGTDVYNKLNAINLGVANYLSDKMVDGVLESLDKSHKRLIEVSNNDPEKEHRRSLLRNKSIESTGSSPKLSTKRKSLHSRKMRPQSCLDANDIETALKLAADKPESESSPTGVVKRVKKQAPAPPSGDGLSSRPVSAAPPRPASGPPGRQPAGLPARPPPPSPTRSPTKLRSIDEAPDGAVRKKAGIDPMENSPESEENKPTPKPRRVKKAGDKDSYQEEGTYASDAPKGSTKTKAGMLSKELAAPATSTDGTIISIDDDHSVQSEGSMDLDFTDTSTVDSLLDSRESTPSFDGTSKSRSKKSNVALSEFDEIAPLDHGAPKLQHLTTNRPKRAKTKAASRAAIKSDAEVLEDIGNMDGGMEDFYANNPVPTDVSPTHVKVYKSNSIESKDKKKAKSPKAPFGGFNLFGGKKHTPKSPEAPRRPAPPASNESPLKSRTITEEPPRIPTSEPPPLSEEKPEKPAEVKKPMLPPGARGMGLPGMGKDMLSEMRLKRATMIGAKSPEDSKKELKKDAAVIEEGKESSPRTSTVGGLKPINPLLRSTDSLRPVAKPREKSSSPGNTLEREKPNVPTRPKPPLLAPKPTPAVRPPSGGSNAENKRPADKDPSRGSRSVSMYSESPSDLPVIKPPRASRTDDELDKPIPVQDENVTNNNTTNRSPHGSLKRVSSGKIEEETQQIFL